MRIIILIYIGFFISLNCWSQEKKEELRMDQMWGEASANTAKLKDSKVKILSDGNFGMFIHWGLYSHLKGIWDGKTYYGIGEWMMNSNMAGISVDEYKKIAKEFNPSEFNAKAIVQLAKDAGMKYMIITSKHHDGFAMFKSYIDSFNIVDATPFGHDPMKELSTACHELGLGFGFYYSHSQDWTTPGGNGGPKTFPNGKTATFDDYFYNKCLPQVKELCSNYGSVDFIWFDTPKDMKKKLVLELVELVHKLQPNALLSSRIGHGLGDFVSLGDMEIPERNVNGLWETCDTNNDSWSYVWYDNNFKSPKETLSRLISTVARGGSYLLNVGPDDSGQIPKTGVDFLKEAGKWLDKYPQVVYGAGASPWGHSFPWGDVTTQDSSLFLSVFNWPQDGKLYLPGLDSKLVSANMLMGAESKEIPFTQTKNRTIFEIPYKPLDSPVSVIELKLGSPAKTAKVDTDLGIFPNVETELSAEFTEVTGAEKKKISWMEKFGEWKHVNQISRWEKASKATWTVEVYQPGYYNLSLRYKGEGRLVWNIITDEGIMIQNQQAATRKYQDYPMGVIEFKSADKHSISVSLVEGDSMTSSLESLKLKYILITE